LAFIKGTRKVSNYFQNFIGSTDLTSSKINAQNLKKALTKFMRENDFTEDSKENIFKEIDNYIKERIKNDEDVHLASISAYVSAEEPQKFMDYVQSNEELEVSGVFRVGRKSDFNYFHKATIEEKGYKLEFEKDLKRTNKIIREGNNIVIKDVPVEILDDEFGEISE
jgi:nucleoid-associated protein YejK